MCRVVQEESVKEEIVNQGVVEQLLKAIEVRTTQLHSHRSEQADTKAGAARQGHGICVVMNRPASVRVH
jgi:hypothetical protein